MARRVDAAAHLAVASVILWWCVAPAAAHDVNPAGAPHDHFECYKAKAAGFVRTVVDVADDFEAARYDVVKPAGLCLPVDADLEGAPDDPSTHLESYRIKLAKTTPRQPKHAKRQHLGVLNRFGTMSVTTVKPDRLLVPTHRDDAQPPSPPNDADHQLDSYTCYKIKEDRGGARFAQRSVQLTGDFDDSSYLARKPSHLCAPTAVEGSQRKNAGGYFACYSLKRLSSTAAHVGRDVLTANRFGAEQVSTKKEDNVCVPSVVVDPDCGIESTFDVIQERVFSARGCAVSTCHGPLGQQADLDLQAGASYPELVGVLASHPVAAAAGKLLVKPGDAAASFLSQKLRGTHDPTEGARMPLIGEPLPDEELDLIDAWIDAGAPQSGIVASAPCPPRPEYVEQAAPPVPPGGYQLVLDGPILQPGQEQEGCMWVAAPNASDFDVLQWEFVLNPGTHHFAVFEYNRAGAPTTNVWTPGDIGCISGAQFGNNVSGAPHAPYYVDAYPPGVARRVRAGSYLGLNAHYYNEFDVPIQMKVWINMYPYPGTPEHIAETIIEIDQTFSIFVPPFQIGLHEGRWTNTSSEPYSIVSLSGHMHKRGKRFTEWLTDGTKIYENFDWSHPIFRYFDPPLVLQPGQYIDYECEHDNGASDIQEVKRRSQGTPCALSETRCIGGPMHDQPCNGVDSVCDSSPGAGDGDCDACPLKFGLSSEDEMCILTGQFYRGQ